MNFLDYSCGEGKPHFDLCISNPPYKNEDLKILNSIGKQFDQIIIVHPTTWLLDNKLKYSIFNDFRKLIKDNIRSIELFNGNVVFGIGIFSPCSITHIDFKQNYEKVKVIEDRIFSEETWQYNSVYDVNIHGNHPEYYSIKKKVEAFIKHHGSVQDHIKRTI